MIHSFLRLVPLVCLGAIAVGCSDSDSGGDPQDAGGAGGCGDFAPCTSGSGGSGGAGAGSPGRVGEGAAPEADDAEGAEDSTASGSGTSSGGMGPTPPPLDECSTCCNAEHTIGADAFVLRVDDSNSFGSPLLVDALLPAWDGLTPLPVRTHEFLNVFAPRVPPAEDGGDLAFDVGASVVSTSATTPEGAPDGEVRLALQVAVRHLETFEAPPRSVTLVVDTSPSVGASVERLLGAIDLVVAQLRPEDALGVVSWSSDAARRSLRPLANLGEEPLDEEALRDSVQREIDLTDGAADLGVALREALDQVRAAPEGVGTVLLVSDGSSGVDRETLDAVTEAAADAVRVVGIGVGPAEDYSDAVLDAITDASGGASLYFDGTDAAAELLESRFREMVDIAHSGVRLRLDLPASVRLVVSSAADTSAVGGEIEGQNLAVGGTMTFHETLRWTDAVIADPCAAIGWAILDEDGNRLGGGSMALGDIFAGLHQSTSLLEGSAVVAATAALKGPTPARLARAIDAMQAASARLEGEGTAWEGHRLEALCGSLQTACERRGAECPSCPVAGSISE